MSRVTGKASSHAKAESSNQSSKMNVFGLDDDLNRIKGYLTGGQKEFFGIAISGKRGSGKTTLAQLVYEDVEVSHHFEARAWFTVGTRKARDVVASLLYSLASGSKTKEEIAVMNWTVTLPTEIYKEMDKKPCLIILDDVCSSGNNIWEDGLESVQEINNGSRIIITTRMEDVKGYKLKHKHIMRPELPEEAKWELFKRRSELTASELQPVSEIQKKISKCCGLPLAIVIIAIMCRGKRSKDLENKLSKFEVKKDLNEILNISYEELPDHLKPCLRYFGRFPKEEEISVEKLCLLWVAEGKATTVDVAKGYYNELIASSLVIEEESGAGGASCRLLQSIHKKCLKLSQDVDSLEVLSSGNKNVTKRSCKLAIYLDTQELLCKIQGAAKDVESTLFIDVLNKNKEKKPRSIDLEKFVNTKVLDFNGVYFKEGKCPKHMEKLKFLKYLSFQGCNLQELPLSIQTNDKLETLDLGVEESCEMVIPDELGKLSKLRHLYFPRAFRRKEDNSKLKLDRAEIIEILENFDPGKCDSNDLKKLKKLRRLTCIEVRKKADLQNILDAINRYEYIHCTLAVKDFDACNKENKKVMENLFACDAIRILDIHGSNFTEMDLNGSEFRELHLPFQQNKMLNLQSLVLRNNAFRANKLVFQCQLFPQLKSLTLENLIFLEVLEMEEVVSSPLAVLTISTCEKLKELPCNGLAEMKALKKLITGGKYKPDVKKINLVRKDKGYTCLATA